jgi:hypothetical protein
MGILERIRTAVSSRAKILERLAVAAGKAEQLAERLKRHAEICEYSNIKAGLQRLAPSQAAQAQDLRGLLAEHGIWPRLPELTPEGSNNWERLSADLMLMVELCRELNLLAVEGGSLDGNFVEKLREIAAEVDRDAGELRDLALKCDPQALD